MPGIAGLVGPSADTSLLPRMLERMRHHPWYVRHDQADPAAGVALGRMALGYVNTAPQPAANEDGTKLAVLEGEIYDYPAHRRALEAKGHTFRTDGHAELLIHGLEEHGEGFLRSIHGCFAAAVWDAAAQTLRLVNDRFGMRPLYYAHPGGRVVFASEVKALFADPGLDRDADPRGLAQFFTFGHFLNEDTSFAKVRLLPAAGVVTYAAAADRLTVGRYARLGETWKPTALTDEQHLDRIDEALHRAVLRCSDTPAPLGLSLSGGLDARTVLGLVPPDRPLQTLCLGMDGSIDVWAAAELARLTNRPHHTHTLDTEFLSSFEGHLRHMVRLTDGQYLCQCIVMPTLPLYRRLGIQVLLRGHAGELMHMTKAYNFSVDDEALNVTHSTVEGWLWRRLQAHMLDGVDGQLFTPAVGADLAGLARESLREALAASDGVDPAAHRIWHTFVATRIRRETGLSMTEFGSVVETRIPYLDPDLVDALMAAPPTLKLAERIQTHVLRKRRPEFLGVVNANTGARMDAGKLAKEFGKLKLRVLAKLGVKGYQPYERLGLWLRRELRDMVRAILLDDRCLGRGVFHPDTVRSVVAGHLDQGKNHTFLLMALMTFELGQREFVDGDAYTDEQPAAALAT
jgi:asparagine synthase (glutamine-hydrolysing)